MKLKNTRTYLEVKVGDRQCMEVVLHLRKHDISWFNASEKGGSSRFSSFLRLLEKNVLPRMMQEEMEETECKLSSKPMPPPLGQGGVPIAEMNETKKKRKRFNRKAAALELQRQEEEAKKSDKNLKSIHYAFDESMTLTYRVHPVKISTTETLLFTDSDKGEDDFCQLHKLSMRLLVWCYPRDPECDPTDPDPVGGGFPRAELVPISDLFRAPP